MCASLSRAGNREYTGEESEFIGQALSAIEEACRGMCEAVEGQAA